MKKADILNEATAALIAKLQNTGVTIVYGFEKALRNFLDERLTVQVEIVGLPEGKKTRRRRKKHRVELVDVLEVLNALNLGYTYMAVQKATGWSNATLYRIADGEFNHQLSDEMLVQLARGIFPIHNKYKK